MMIVASFQGSATWQSCIWHTAYFGSWCMHEAFQECHAHIVPALNHALSDSSSDSKSFKRSTGRVAVPSHHCFLMISWQYAGEDVGGPASILEGVGKARDGRKAGRSERRAA